MTRVVNHPSAASTPLSRFNIRISVIGRPRHREVVLLFAFSHHRPVISVSHRHLAFAAMTTTAFTAPAPVASRAAFSGGAVSVSTSAPAPSAAATTMSLNRRSALGLGLGALGAALLKGAAPVHAKSGEFARQSIFGVGGASSPFDAGIQRSGTVQYSKFAPAEMAYFKSIVDGSSTRLDSAKTEIDNKSWEAVRSTIRLEMSLLRQTMLSVQANIADPKVKASAQKLYDAFKKDVNDMDYACVLKNQDKARKSFKLTVTDLASWREVASI
jgi:Oxygen evolving enhancer protein 3 (PsbQ)